MCRWGCTTTNTTYMCKWCGTRYCRECLHGAFVGVMLEPTHCRMCNQKKCQGARVEYVPRTNSEADDPKKRSTSARARSARSTSAKRSKSAKTTRSKSGKKSGKKKKKKK